MRLINLSRQSNDLVLNDYAANRHAFTRIVRLSVRLSVCVVSR